ncbi:MAG TPA: hypothetical protein VJV05_05645 [Pyrinomonadaceae bacterium]|nr:hypothetical protein [Pyrinomonadaceae bacterium]
MRKGKPIQVEYQTLVVVWLALLVSQVLFFAIVWFVKPYIFQHETPPPFFGTMPLVILVFSISAIAFLLLSFVLSRQHMQRAARDQDASCVQTGLILGCALSEIPSILGLVLAFAFDYPYFYVWIALGTLGMLLHFPRKGNLDAAMFKIK